MDRYSTEVQETNTSNTNAVTDILKKMQQHESLPSENGNKEMPDNEQILIPEWVYESLPQPLRTLCAFFEDGFERDVFLTALLAVVSGILSDVNYKHRDGWKGVNLFALVIAPASSGKGDAAHAKRLGEKIDERLREESEREIAEWEQLKKQAEAAEKYNATHKKGEQKEVPEVGPKPPFRTFFISANTSYRAQFNRLWDNNGAGMVFDTELITFLTANKQEWGAALDTYLKGFHNESISLDRAGDVSQFVSKPRFGVFLSGTPNSLDRMFKYGIEDGLFSRMMPYRFEAKAVWRSQAPQQDFDAREAAFETAATFFDELHVRLSKIVSRSEKPFPCWFKTEQWKRLDSTFEHMTNALNASGVDSKLHASLRRDAAIAQRIACILAVLRHAEEVGSMTSLNPSDEDVGTGLSLAHVYLAHAFRVAAKLPVPAKSNLSGPQLQFLATLPERGSKHNFYTIAESLNVKERKARRWKDKFEELGLIQWQPDGMFVRMNSNAQPDKSDKSDTGHSGTPEF